MDHPRYGYQRLHALLIRERNSANHKRKKRLCSGEALRVRVSRRKRALMTTATACGDWLQATFPNRVWALDIAFDQTTDRRMLKILTDTEEFIKSALAIEDERAVTRDYRVSILDQLLASHEHQRLIHMDNDTETTCNAIAD